MDLISLFLHQERVKQFINDIGSCRYRTKSARLAQCFCRFCIFAFHVTDRIFHGGEQRCLRKISRRRCLSGCNCHFCDRHTISLFHGRQRLFFRCRCQIVRFFPFFIHFKIFIGFFPALALHNLTFCRKTLSCQPAGKYGLIILKCRKQYCQESTYYQIIDLTLFVRHRLQIHKLLGRNDRMVIRHFFIVHKRSIFADRTHGKASCQFTVRSDATCL